MKIIFHGKTERKMRSIKERVENNAEFRMQNSEFIMKNERTFTTENTELTEKRFSQV